MSDKPRAGQKRKAQGDNGGKGGSSSPALGASNAGSSAISSSMMVRALHARNLSRFQSAIP